MSLNPTTNIAAYMSGINAETFDRADDPTADAEGHVVTATVLRSEGENVNLVPVRVRVAHGVSAQTASAMLRKMADALDAAPDFLSSPPGAALRRMPDGSVARKQLTPEKLAEVAEAMGEDDRRRFYEMLDRIRFQISPDEPQGPNPE